MTICTIYIYIHVDVFAYIIMNTYTYIYVYVCIYIRNMYISTYIICFRSRTSVLLSV